MNDSRVEVDSRRFAAVRRTAVYKAIVAAWDQPVLLACSGGIDSTALLAAGAIARDAGRVASFVVVHVDHQVREGSAKEGRFVASLARAFGCPFVQLRLTPQSDFDRESTEAALRSMRYTALAGLAGLLALNGVVTAHTKDDQIETILLRLLSGSSSIANAGMRAEQQLDTAAGPLRLIRPLLTINRSELMKVLDHLALPHIEDPSNADVTFRRNRLRHRVIPELKALDPGFGDALIRAVGYAKSDAELADRLASEMYSSVVRHQSRKRIIRRADLETLDIALASRIVRRAVLELINGDHREVTQERISAVIDAASGSAGAVIELPYGIDARVERVDIVIETVERGL